MFYETSITSTNKNIKMHHMTDLWMDGISKTPYENEGWCHDDFSCLIYTLIIC